ncbi:MULTISPECIES: SEL1-like repeat protein [unclassified Gilliamella]|uniref:SEL1-like repeat protein n=1 Tax=unclassified Gilliamella TaxID=2685620 RepID=UPI0013290421|nr:MULTISPECIES: tetratricopeptide repeat protein [unclassified Gilliamella]MWN32196.1 hypothetical protein [Gilliamella sp. Pra-s60]MWP29482.1 hypothetical protein [Gilliamella sp. Pra-s54]
MYKFILSIIIIFELSNQVFANTINQKIWSLAINKNDNVAQYIVAQAYNPLVENDDWDCLPHQFYLELKNKKLAGCQDKSADKYIEFLTKSAKNLYPLSQTALGIAYVKGKLVNKDIKKGIFWLEKAASPIPDKAKFSVGEGTLWLNEQGRKYGVGQAQYVLATLYDEGVDVKSDYAKAVKYYEMASKSYDFGFYGYAQYQLFNIYKNKLNNPQKAIYWLEQALYKLEKNIYLKKNENIINAVSNATDQIIEYFLNGGQIDGSKSELPNYELAAKYLGQFVENYEIKNKIRKKMALKLAWLYLNGLGIEKNPEQAAKYYHLGVINSETIKKDKNNDQSLEQQFLFDVIEPIYESSTFTQSEIYHLINSTDKNNKENITNAYSQFYITNASKIVEKVFGENRKDEERFYTKLVDEIQYVGIESYQTYNSATPILALAQKRGIAYGYYREAQNINGKTPEQLLDLYQSALTLEPENPKIIYGLGTLYDFIIKDSKTAITHYQKAANLGYRLANYRLGVIYYLGKGVKQNYQEAWRYLNLAAEQGYLPAQNFVMTVDKSHPDLKWLTTQYVNHRKNYRSPTVEVKYKVETEVETEVETTN